MRDAQDVATPPLLGDRRDRARTELLSDGSELPVFAFTLAPDVDNYTVFDVSDRLRQRGWLVPAYTFPENRQDLSVLRIVVRAGMTFEMADLLLEHLREQTEFLESLTAPMPRRGPAGVRPQLIAGQTRPARPRDRRPRVAPSVARLEDRLQVEDPQAERVELARARRSRGTARRSAGAASRPRTPPCPRGSAVDPSLAGHHRARRAHPQVEAEWSSMNAPPARARRRASAHRPPASPPAAPVIGTPRGSRGSRAREVAQPRGRAA